MFSLSHKFFLSYNRVNTLGYLFRLEYDTIHRRRRLVILATSKSTSDSGSPTAGPTLRYVFCLVPYNIENRHRLDVTSLITLILNQLRHRLYKLPVSSDTTSSHKKYPIIHYLSDVTVPVPESLRQPERTISLAVIYSGLQYHLTISTFHIYES